MYRDVTWRFTTLRSWALITHVSSKKTRRTDLCVVSNSPINSFCILNVQFAFSLPHRLRKCINTENYVGAAKYYYGSLPILKVIFFPTPQARIQTDVFFGTLSWTLAQTIMPTTFSLGRTCMFIYSFFMCCELWKSRRTGNHLSGNARKNRMQ